MCIDRVEKGMTAFDHYSIIAVAVRCGEMKRIYLFNCTNIWILSLSWDSEKSMRYYARNSTKIYTTISIEL